MNGWRIDYGHAQEEEPQNAPRHTLRATEALRRCFPRHGLKAVRDFLLARKKPHFTLCYHTHDSRNSQKGFPDLVLVHPERARIIFAELKNDTSYPSTEQRLWAAGLLCVSEEYPDAISYRLWKPKHYASIIEDLGEIDPLLYY